MAQIELKEEKISDDEYVDDVDVNEEKLFLDDPIKVEYSFNIIEPKKEPNSGSLKSNFQHILPDYRYEGNTAENQPYPNYETNSAGYTSPLSEYLEGSDLHSELGIFGLAPGGDLLKPTLQKLSDLTSEDLNQLPTSVKCFPMDEFSTTYPPKDKVKRDAETSRCVSTEATVSNRLQPRIDANGRPIAPPFQRERPFQCGQCKIKFMKRYHLKMHEKTHSGEKLYKCEKCDQAFAHKGSLIRHIRKHTGDYTPYECEYCKQRFSQRRDLNTHLMSHTGEKKIFACDQCDFKYFTSKSLRYHQAKHAMENSFKCDLCEERFFQKEALDNHRQSHSVCLNGVMLRV